MWHCDCTLHYQLHITHYTLNTTHCTLHTTHYTLHTTHYTLHTTHYTLHTTHYTLHTTHYTLHTAHCTLHTTHYTLQDIPLSSADTSQLQPQPQAALLPPLNDPTHISFPILETRIADYSSAPWVLGRQSLAHTEPAQPAKPGIPPHSTAHCSLLTAHLPGLL